ncbi:MAG: SDR family oxidoreductase [Thermoleophilia bacterium]|nr:SDR family oxidoreductase [Thermoleophilia bacterium]
MDSLRGRVIAIPGAGGSLGPFVARRLAEAGATVSLAGRNPERLAPLAAELRGADIEGIDLLDEAAVRVWAERLAAEHGGVDAVAHLVGGYRGGTPIEESAAEDWDVLSALLVRTTQNVGRAFAPHLLASGRGRFAIVSSGQAQQPSHAAAAYAAAKAAAETWTFALADRFRGSGSTANAVVIGAIVTPEMRAERPDETFATFTPAGDIAEAIAYLLSDAAATMNGQRLVLRGAA